MRKKPETAALFVPEAEQPYKIPDNWHWLLMETVCNFERGITFPATVKESQPTSENIPCLRTANVQEELDLDSLIYVDKAYIKNNSAKFTCAGDIIMSSANSRELVGKTCYVHSVPFPMTFGGFVLTIRARKVNSKYLFYFLRNEFVSGRFMEIATQTTNIANINTAKLSRYAIPFPPLAEQQRIVDRIESLFAKLDAAREKAREVVDGFELRKAAILYRAFSGELTAQWREINGISLESWENTTLSKVVGGFRYGTSEKSDYSYSGMPVLRIPNIGDDGIDFSDVKFLKALETESANQVHENDILIIRSNGSRDLVGKCALVPILDKPFAYASFLIKITPSDKIKPHFLLLYLNSANAHTQMFLKAKSSAGIHNINSKELGALSIRLPGVREQEEIVEIVQDMLSKESQAVSAARQTVDNINTMKKAILGRAFRGELGTNDPSEASPDFSVIIR